MTRDRPRERADGRPRVHLWPGLNGWHWSIGPAGQRTAATSPGAGLDEALDRLDILGAGGVVVIVEGGGRA